MNWQKISEKLPPSVQKNGLIWLGIAGILLILLSEPLFGGGTDQKKQPFAANAEDPQSVFVQERQLEERLGEILSRIEGAGETIVMITLDTSDENIYAQNETVQYAGEEGGLPGRSEREHVLLNEGGGQHALLQTVASPQVRGAAVVCQGAEDITVVGRITEAVAVLLDLPTSRICVTKMN